MHLLTVINLVQDLFDLILRGDVRIIVEVVEVVVGIEISSIVKVHLSGNYNDLYFKITIIELLSIQKIKLLKINNCLNGIYPLRYFFDSDFFYFIID